ncbi:Na+/H+ antiporter subunit E [Streptomyces avicenniae]|uniref:Na+/H+ antiporter subunit E n=1 Tax=Streptomyces avicenniae TaxID=500153 RepID=UPI000699C0A4|nr:Na+/H+ antiporter subunit E [Streptomyces avicenniae]
MTPTTRRPDARSPARRLLRRLPMLAWLLALWVVLWASLSAVVVLGGLLVGAVVLAAFPMPEVGSRVRARPARMLALVARMPGDLVASAVRVGWAAVRLGPRVPSAVVEVRLASDSDLLITATAVLTTISPGSLVLEIDRGRRQLYVHVLPMEGPRAVADGRRLVHQHEGAVVRALGPAAEVRAVVRAERERRQAARAADEEETG